MVGTLQRLPNVVSAGHVAELAYTGKDIDAARAEKIGLVNDIYPDVDAVCAAARELALEIAANPPLAVRGTKFILQQSENLTTEQSLLLNGLWTMATTLNSNDLVEAVASFKKAIEIDSSYGQAYNNLGSLYYEMGRKEEGIVLLKQAIALNPNYAKAYYNLSLAYFLEKQYDLALEYCDQARRLGLEVQPGFLRDLQPYRED